MSNNWKVEPSTITFFEKVLREHRKVATFQRTRDILFSLSLIDGREMRVLLVNVYTLGLADVIEARNEFPELNHVVTASAWNSYTKEAKQTAAANGMGVFVVGEFMGAIHSKDPIKYKKKAKKKGVSRYARPL